MNNILDNFLEVELYDPEDFLKIAETLKRIGILSVKTNTLFQSAHILHKRGRYYIVSFKEMFMLDNKVTDFTEEDRRRRSRIAKLLESWGLLKIKNSAIMNGMNLDSKVQVIPYRDKSNYSLVSKYSMGKQKKVCYND